MKNKHAVGAALLALALPPSAGHALTYAKHGVGGTSATGGTLLSNAEVTTGLGDLTEITGALNFTKMGLERATVYQSYADLFEIYLTGNPFSATTVGQTGDPADPSMDLTPTVLYLFDSQGLGVMDNVFDPNAIQSRSTIASSSLAPGLYYLGIGAIGDQPTSGGGLTFPDQSDPSVDLTATYGPAGSGGGAPLSGWDTSSGLDAETGTYGISLVGVRAAAVPEASSAVLLLAGGCLLLGVAVRRRQAAWA